MKGESIRPEAKENILQMTKIMRTLAKKNIRQRAVEFAGIGARRTRGFNEDDILEILYPKSGASIPQSLTAQEMPLRRGQVTQRQKETGGFGTAIGSVNTQPFSIDEFIK